MSDRQLAYYELKQRCELAEKELAQLRTQQSDSSSEQRNRAILSALPDILFRLDSDCRFVDCQANIPEQLFLPAEKFIGKTVYEVLPPDIAELTSHKISVTIQQGELQVYQYSLDHNGMKRDYESRMVPCGNKEVLVIVRDVTEHNKAIEALRESEGIMRALINSSNDIMVYKDRDLVFRMINPAACRIMKLREEDFIGKTDYDICPANQAEHFQTHDRKVLESGQPLILDEEVVGGDGLRYINTVKSPVFNAEGECIGVMSLVRDVTETKVAEMKRQELERQIIEARKHESLARMAGAIAHNFNNILLAVIGNLSLALEEYPFDGPVREYLEDAEKSSQRAEELARLMLLYVGEGHRRHEVFDLGEFLAQQQTKFRSRIPSNIVFGIKQTSQGHFCLSGDKDRLAESIDKLIVNAVEAIGDQNGHVEIGLTSRRISETELANSYLLEKPNPGEFVSLSVRDDGCGILPESRPFLFDPFYSTKFTGRGLGLAVVLGVMRRHQGAILVTSETGSGSCFELLFPAAKQS